MDHEYRWLRLNDRGGVDIMSSTEPGAVRVMCPREDETLTICDTCGARYAARMGRLDVGINIGFCIRCGTLRIAEPNVAWESYARAVEMLDAAREGARMAAFDDRGVHDARAMMSPPAVETKTSGDATGSKVMNKIKEAGSVLKSNSKSAAWRSAAKKSARAARAPIVAALEALTGDSKLSSSLAAFMATDNGLALTGVFVGAIPLILPEVSNDPNLLRLAEEMRIGGIEIVTDQVADKLMAPVMSIFAVGLASLKAAGVALPEAVVEAEPAKAAE